MLLPRPLSNDPRFIQCIYRYSHASKPFVGVYIVGTCILRSKKFSQYLYFVIKSTRLDLLLSNCMHELFYRNLKYIHLLHGK